jgi:hypothetical protein
MFSPDASKRFKAVLGDVIFAGETRSESEAMSPDIDISSNAVTDAYPESLMAPQQIARQVEGRWS